MGDEHDGAGKAEQEVLQPFDGRDVQVVGGLVQQQHVGRTHQRLRQQHATLHAAGQRGEVGIAVQLQARQGLAHARVQVPAVAGLDALLRAGHGFGIPVVRGVVEGGQLRAEVAQAFGDHVEHGTFGVLRHGLGQARHAQGVAPAHLAVVGRDFAVQQAQQRGLAGAVAADHAHALAALEGEVDAVQQQRAADAVVDLDQLQQGHRAYRVWSVFKPYILTACGGCPSDRPPRASGSIRGPVRERPRMRAFGRPYVWFPSSFASFVALP